MRVRLPVLTFAMILALVACGKRDPVASGANDVTGLPPPAKLAAPSPAGAPPQKGTAPAADSTTATTGAIPAALQGRWGLTPQDCTSPLADAKGLLVVNGGELRFFESRAVPADNIETNARSISGNFDFSGEGRTWTRFETLERQTDKLVRTETNPTASFTYAKC